MSKPLDKQVGGNHYKDLAIQPVEYIFKNNLGYCEGCVIKYVTRWKNKGGVQDLLKAKHFLELLIELQEQKDGLLAQEVAEGKEYDDTGYCYLILANSPRAQDLFVGKFEESDAEKFYPNAVKFYTREGAETAIQFNLADFYKHPHYMAFYQYGETEKQLYLARVDQEVNNA